MASTWWLAWWRRTAGATLRLPSACPRLAAQKLSYRGKELEELDLDGASRAVPRSCSSTSSPTPTPRLRHDKRWQDVLELLDAGIEVFTTLNVQHVDSLNDVIAQITGVQVRETVPDAVLDRADEIELVDVSPEELLARLSRGQGLPG
jgi:two-component system sensor histidine kinase KdpD